MSVEVDDADPLRGAELGDRGRRRPGDGVVAAEDDRDRPAARHIANLAVDHGVRSLDPGGHDVRVARVDDGQDVERVDLELQGVEAARGVVGLADGPRAEPGAGPVADRVVERRTDDGDVHAQSSELVGVVDPGQLPERHRPDVDGQVVVGVGLELPVPAVAGRIPGCGSRIVGALGHVVLPESGRGMRRRGWIRLAGGAAGSIPSSSGARRRHRTARPRVRPGQASRNACQAAATSAGSAKSS